MCDSRWCVYFYECTCVYVHVVTQDLGPLGSITGNFGPQPQLTFHTVQRERVLFSQLATERQRGVMVAE